MEKPVPEHRIRCSFRLLIGPLDDNSPSPFWTSQHSRPEPGSSQNNATPHFEAMHDTDNISPKLSTVANHDDNKTTHHGQPSSSRNNSNTFWQNGHATTVDSITTAQCTNITMNDDTQHHAFSSQLQSSTDPASITSAKSSNFNSALPSTLPTDADVTNSKSLNTSHYDTGNGVDTAHENDHQSRLGDNKAKHDSNHTMDRTVLWRNSGPVFVPPLPKHYINNNNSSSSNYTNTVIKHGVLLCNRLPQNCSGKQPSVYKQCHTHTTTPKRPEDWRQLEIILTPDAFTCFASSGLVWPKRSVQHRISLAGETDSNLSLYLLSPLDYTFCIQYTTSNEKDAITLVFRARSVTLCQEWYMAIYQLLPAHARKPTPHECKIYIPSINIYVHLPLIKLQPSENEEIGDPHDSRYFITMDHVKEATIDLLENDPDWQAVLGNQLDHKDLSLCWIRNERAEWISWKKSVDGNQVVDMALCPQNIEQTHRLELRPVQHTPNTIILTDGITLKEPYPCEGFLIKITSFEGRHLKASTWGPKRFYFATFDGFLFVIPADKAIAPHTRTYVDPTTNPQSSMAAQNEFNHHPFVTLVTPFADNNNLVHGWQHEERARRMKLISSAVGCINLTEVAFVQQSSDRLAAHHDGSNIQHNAHGPYQSFSTDLATSSTTSLLTQDEPSLSSSLLSDCHHHHHHWDRQQCGIDLVMENGIIIKLEAYSSETCNQWISGLSDLILYSKARLEADRDIHGDNVNNASLSMDSVTGMHEKDDMDSTSCGSSACQHGTPGIKPSNVDTRIWSVCLFTQCRDIVKSGILYVQSKGVFSQKQFILTVDGRLHYFNVFKRAMDDGQPIQTGIHERKGTLDMANAYIYSGMMSTFDNESSQARLDLLPRLFDNGITTNDSDEHCLFTVWIPQRRRIFSPRRQMIITYNSDRRFNSTGQCWLFMALSRQDKEAWLWAISVIQEQLLREAIQ